MLSRALPRRSLNVVLGAPSGLAARCLSSTSALCGAGNTRRRSPTVFGRPVLQPRSAGLRRVFIVADKQDAASAKINPRADVLKKEINDIVTNNKVVVFGKSWCNFSSEAIVMLQSLGVTDLKVVEADHRRDEDQFMSVLKEMTSQKTVPQIFIGGELVKGEKNDGYDDLVELHKQGELKSKLEKLQALDKELDLPSSAFDFELFVVGGGSGGCAAALEAARNEELRIAVADFVKPSPGGTSWGIGGTCSNVGCIPKKLMHIASTMAENAHDLKSFGFTTKSGDTVELKHDWDTLCKGIHSYIKGQLNQGMLDGFEANNVNYFNAYATLKDRHTIELDDGKGGKETKTAKYIMLAAGGRPSNGNYPGADGLCISSDDLFWLEKPPGKTLVVGAAYIALECAGFLTGLGYDTTVMVRSMLLRGFDRECVDRIDAYMQKMGTKFHRGVVPSRFEPGTERKVKVVWEQENGQELSEEFDTVLLAIGRKGEAVKLGLENAGVRFNASTGKVVAPCEMTNVPNISCVGDLVEDRPELTPVAKVAGKSVVKRLFAGEDKPMSYSGIATTVFTPLEYAMSGLTEEQCREKYGDDGFQVITKQVKPLEWAIAKHRTPDAFFKVLVDTKTAKIVGFHILGPNAGEIIQAVALAMKMGVRKDQLDDLVGIHPSLAETMTMMSGKTIKGVACES